MRKTYLGLVALIVVGTMFALYGQHAVFRYPRLALDPVPRPVSLMLDAGLNIKAAGAYVKDAEEARFRAYQPDVSLQLSSTGQPAQQLIRLENIHPQAIFSHSGGSHTQVVESAHGLFREIELSGMLDNEILNLSWTFPQKQSYRFVAIGDTGGDRELSWGLIRAHELKADFVLHMGDAYYDTSEKGGIGRRMNEAEMPVYTANGNHDFLGPNGNAIEEFLTHIGPMNARFSLLETCFINLDTGAFMYPPHKGERAGMLAAEVVNQRRAPSRCVNTIVFTHKPLLTKLEAQFPQRERSLLGYDSRRIMEQLQQLNAVTIIAGHVHDDFEFTQDGFKTYVTGGGLAHKDLVQGGHYARVLVGEIRENEAPGFEWALSGMPMDYHCSNKIYELLKYHKSPLANEVHEACVGKP